MKLRQLIESIRCIQEGDCGCDKTDKEDVKLDREDVRLDKKLIGLLKKTAKSKR